MTTYRYRAATPAGAVRSGLLQGASIEDVVAQLRRQGLLPIETTAAAGARAARRGRPNGRSRRAMINAVGEMGVLLDAGLTLDRALAVCVDNILDPTVKAAFAPQTPRPGEGRRAIVAGDGRVGGSVPSYGGGDVRGGRGGRAAGRGPHPSRREPRSRRGPSPDRGLLPGLSGPPPPFAWSPPASSWSSCWWWCRSSRACSPTRTASCRSPLGWSWGPAKRCEIGAGRWRWRSWGRDLASASGFGGLDRGSRWTGPSWRLPILGHW